MRELSQHTQMMHFFSYVFICFCLFLSVFICFYLFLSPCWLGKLRSIDGSQLSNRPALFFSFLPVGRQIFANALPENSIPDLGVRLSINEMTNIRCDYDIIMIIIIMILMKVIENVHL